MGDDEEEDEARGEERPVKCRKRAEDEGGDEEGEKRRGG